MKNATQVAIVLLMCAVLSRQAGAVGVSGLEQLGVYVTGTATIATALEKLSESIKRIYNNVMPIVDKQVCRNHKDSLQELVLDFRQLEAQKIRFAKKLHELATLPRAPRAEGMSIDDRNGLRIIHGAVLDELAKIKDKVRIQRRAFTGSVQISKSYASLNAIIDAKSELMRTYRNIDWDQSGRSFRASNGRTDFAEFDRQLNDALKQLTAALDSIAEEANKPCANNT